MEEVMGDIVNKHMDKSFPLKSAIKNAHMLSMLKDSSNVVLRRKASRILIKEFIISKDGISVALP